MLCEPNKFPLAKAAFRLRWRMRSSRFCLKCEENNKMEYSFGRLSRFTMYKEHDLLPKRLEPHRLWIICPMNCLVTWLIIAHFECCLLNFWMIVFRTMSKVLYASKNIKVAIAKNKNKTRFRFYFYALCDKLFQYMLNESEFVANSFTYEDCRNPGSASTQFKQCCRIRSIC